jgi:WYL domain
MVVEQQTPRLRWGTEQRLEFIEFRLFWDGSVNRSDITERFGISAAQASADLTQIRELARENIHYDSSVKSYLPTDNFRPRVLKPNAEHYLAQLWALSDNIIAPIDTWIGELPEVGITPVSARGVEPGTLRTFLATIRKRRSIWIEYQSLNDSRPDPIWREITPHAFGSDGLRWHLRAYCHIENVFKDFIISRCLQIGKLGEPGLDAAKDVDWSTFFDVILVPNPKLSPAQQKTIERDYGMKDGRSELRVRRALLYYLDKRLRLDVAEKQDRPKETPIIVANRNEYDATLRQLSC